MISDYFNLALKNLRKRKLRTWLTMLGIFISIATIFTLISLSIGLQDAVEEQFKTLGTDKFFILPNTGFLGPPGSVGGDILTEEHLKIIENVRGVKDYSYISVANAKVEFSGQTKYFMVVGIPLDRTEVFTSISGWDAEEGSLIDENDEGRLMLGYLFKYGNIFNKPIETGDKLIINDRSFKVNAIINEIGNPSDDTNIIMSIEELRDLFNIPNRIDQVVVQIEEGQDINEVADNVEKKLRNYKDQTEKTQDFTISTPDELLQSFKTILNIITVFLAGIAAISLLVGAIGIANTMYTSVVERTKEIGVMKAIGAKNSDVMWIFLIESGLLGLVGGIIGVALGYSLSKTIELIAINQFDTNLLQAASPLWLIFGCLAFGFLVGAISGTLPALQASKTNVVDALRYE